MKREIPFRKSLRGAEQALGGTNRMTKESERQRAEGLLELLLLSQRREAIASPTGRL